MKKLLLTALAVAGTAVTALGAMGCSGAVKVSVKDIELTSEEYAFAVAKDAKELLAQVNTYLTEWKDDGSLGNLINSYFDGKAEFSYSNKTSSPQEGDFVVATNAYFPPFEYYNDNSEFAGADIEIAYNIAQKLGKTLYVKDMNFDAIIPSIKAGECHIGMAGITVNEERKKDVDFAIGYYESAQVITVREDDTTFDGCTTVEEAEAKLKAQDKIYTVGTQAGTTGFMYSNGDEGFGYTGFTNLTTKAYDTGALAMMDLKNGKINAVILDKQPSLMIAESINK